MTIMNTKEVPIILEHLTIVYGTVHSTQMAYKKYFPRSSITMYLTSHAHQFSYEMIMKWWAWEVKMIWK